MAAQARGTINCKAARHPAVRAAVRQVIMLEPAVVMVRGHKAKAMRVPQALATTFLVAVAAPVHRVRRGVLMVRLSAGPVLKIVF